MSQEKFTFTFQLRKSENKEPLCLVESNKEFYKYFSKKTVDF